MSHDAGEAEAGLSQAEWRSHRRGAARVAVRSIKGSAEFRERDVGGAWITRKIAWGPD
jgi:hypothetical protein